MRKKVFCIGVWDMFHAGHLSLIKQAASYGELTVGVVMDQAVKRQKGESRPIISHNSRCDIVESLKCVHLAVLIDDFIITPLVLQNHDIIVLGADQTHIKNLDQIPEEKIIRIGRPKDGNCTSEILKKIRGS